MCKYFVILYCDYKVFKSICFRLCLSSHICKFFTCFSYWGSYELTIPGGSGSGNAVQHLSLPDNAPEFFQFSALKNGPLPAPTFQNGPPPAPTFQNGPPTATTFQNGPIQAPTFPPVQQKQVQQHSNLNSPKNAPLVVGIRGKAQHLVVLPHPEGKLM